MRWMQSSTSRSTLAAQMKTRSARSTTRRNRTDLHRTGQVKRCSAILHTDVRRQSGLRSARSMENLGGGIAVMLIPARTDTKVFHEYIYGKAEIRFVKGRIKFGGSKWNAPFPSMIVVFREAQGDRH